MILLIIIMFVLCMGIDGLFNTSIVDGPIMNNQPGLAIIICIIIAAIVFDSWNAWNFWSQYDIDWSFQLVKEGAK